MAGEQIHPCTTQIFVNVTQVMLLRSTYLGLQAPMRLPLVKILYSLSQLPPGPSTQCKRYRKTLRSMAAVCGRLETRWGWHGRGFRR
jgi:hypothetical protein